EEYLSEEGLSNRPPLRRHRLELRRGLRERHVDDLVAVQRCHPAELPLVDQVGGLEPVTRGKHSVTRRGGAAPLDMAQDRDPRLVTGSLLDLARELRADA